MKDEALRKLRELQDYNITKKKFDANIDYIEDFIRKSSEPKIITPKRHISIQWLQQRIREEIDEGRMDSVMFSKTNTMIAEYEKVKDLLDEYEEKYQKDNQNEI